MFAVTFPIGTMREGKDAQQDMGSLVHFYKIRFPQKYLDLSVPSPTRLSLIQREGRIHLNGSHCVNFFGYKDIGAGDDVNEEDEDTDDNDEEDKDPDDVADIKKAKDPDEDVDMKETDDPIPKVKLDCYKCYK